MARKTTFPFDPSLLGCALTFSATLRWISESRNYRREDDRVSIKILFIFGNIFWTFLKIRKVGKYVATCAMGICSILNNKTRKKGRMCTIVVRDISSKVINSSVTLDNLFCVISQRCRKFILQMSSPEAKLIDSTFCPLLDFIVEKQIPEEGDVHIGNSKF